MDLYCPNVNTDNSPVQNPGNTQDLKKAEELFNTGSRDKAVIVLERMVARNRQNQAAKKCLSNAYYVMAGQLNESAKGSIARQNKIIIFMKKSIQYDPKNVDAYLLLGQVYERIGQEYSDKRQKGLAKLNYEKAQAAYLSADQLDPKGKSTLSLAKAYALLGKPDLAWKSLERYLENNPQNLGETVIVLEKITSANSKDIKAHKLLAAAYNNVGKIDLAISEFKKVIELEPKQAENHFNLGITYIIKKEYNLAIISLEKAVLLDPNKPEYQQQLSKVYYLRAFTLYGSFQIGEESWKKMISDLHKAIKVDSKNEDAHLLLGKICQEIAEIWKGQGNKEQALHYYKAAQSEYVNVLKLNPKNKVVYDLVEVCFYLEDYKLVHEALKRYLDITEDPKAKDLLKIIEFKVKKEGKTK